MWHAIYMHVNQSNSQLLMVRSQIDTLTPDLCFDHNLFCKYSSGSYEPMLDIFVSRTFQMYKKLFNPMSFDLSNHSLEIQDSIRTSTPKVGIHLGMCGFIPSHSFTILRMWMWFPGCIFGPHLSIPLPWA
jgi:hypothetical protein